MKPFHEQEEVLASQRRGGALDKEINTYRKHLETWSDKSGQYVLICGTTVKGFFPTYDEAIEKGYKQFGLGLFLVKQVNVPERTHFISRLVAPCSS